MALAVEAQDRPEPNRKLGIGRASLDPASCDDALWDEYQGAVPKLPRDTLPARGSREPPGEVVPVRLRRRVRGQVPHPLESGVEEVKEDALPPDALHGLGR